MNWRRLTFLIVVTGAYGTICGGGSPVPPETKNVKHLATTRTPRNSPHPAPEAAVRAEESATPGRRDVEFDRVLAVARNSGKVRVLVQLDVPNLSALTKASHGAKGPVPGAQADDRLSNAIAAARQVELGKLAGTPHTINRTYASVPFVAMTVSERALEALRAAPGVRAITEDRLAASTLDNTAGIVGASAAWTEGFDGSGWYVAILDTGVRASHHFFAGKNIVQACFAQGDDGSPGSGDCPNGQSSDTTSPNAAQHHATAPSSTHGTHVAGIAVGNDPTRVPPLSGIAPGADFIAIQVFSQFENAVGSWSSDQIAGLEYVYSLRTTRNIASANMSLGGGSYQDQGLCDADNAGVKAAIDNLRGAGIPTIIAAGNSEHCDGVAGPACISTAIAVGATTDADFEASFSNYQATLLDLYAPGVNILSAVNASDASYDGTPSGTSMAAPHVAGAWAILKQADPEANVASILQTLQMTGKPVAGRCTAVPNQRRIRIDLALGTKRTNFDQPPDGSGEGAASNLDWTDTTPNLVVADDFVSDGRPITKVRWWGSNLSLGAATSTYSPDSPALSPGPLTSYSRTNHVARPPASANRAKNHPNVTGPGCILVNGDFETGTLAGWTVADVGSLGSWSVNTGLYDPPSPDPPLPPCGGSFSAMADMTGSGSHTLYQDVTIPTSASAALFWTDMIRNHNGTFVDPGQEFRVQIRNPINNAVLATLFSTNPGDVALQSCTRRCGDISAFVGQTVRITFEEQDSLFYFNVHVDDVCVVLDAPCPTGACCIVGPDCLQNQSAAECASRSGVYQGDGSIACTDCPTGVTCGPGAGDCCAAHANPGCDNASCCAAVCAVDSFCCDLEWDQLCVEEAQQICGPGGCNVLVCGDSILAFGEDCDPPDGVTCNDSCQFINCGDGVVDGPEECDPPDAILCDANCRSLPQPPIDGWLIGFHEPLGGDEPPRPPLALYFCDVSVVSRRGTALGACDGHAVIDHAADLVNCCMVRSYADGRNGLTPGQPAAFVNAACLPYAIDIQAVIGHKFVDVDGVCTEVETGHSAAVPFWGWLTTGTERGLGPALQSVISMSGSNQFYGPWSPLATTCAAPNMAYQLISDTSGGGDCNGNGVPDACEAGADCQPNGVFDTCDIGSGASEDCDGLGVPDECDLRDGTYEDCQDNEVPDVCELADHDLNENGIPDVCDPPSPRSICQADKNRFLGLVVPGTANGASFQTDDGSAEDSVGLNDGADGQAFGWATRFKNATGASITLLEIDVAFGLAAGGTGVAPGDAIDAVIWIDAAATGNLRSAVTARRWSLPGGVHAADATFATHAVPCGGVTVPSGADFYVGLGDVQSPNDARIRFPAALDQGGSAEKSWVFFHNSQNVFDPDDFADQTVGTIDGFGLPGNWLLRARAAGGFAETGGGVKTALRVKLMDLQNPAPPNAPNHPPPNFSAFEFGTTCADPSGCVRWVGAPSRFLESQSDPNVGNFLAAHLQCTPHYQDWSVEGAFYITGAEIVASSQYDVQAYGASCAGAEGSCLNISPPLRLTTARAGDVAAPFNPPAASTQPDALDVTALVNKFKNVAGAAPKAVAQLQPNLPELNADVSALDIVACVDAVKELPYALSGPCPCPSPVACGEVACPAGPATCVTAFGAGAMCVKTCIGGDNAEDPCINNTHCPGGDCGDPYCRDACGRCSP